MSCRVLLTFDTCFNNIDPIFRSVPLRHSPLIKELLLIKYNPPILAMIFSLSVLVSLTLSTLASADGTVGVKLSKISEVMPVKTSDFTATYFDGSIEGSTDEKKSKSSIVLLGGCISEDGNKYISEAEYPGFACQEFSDQATVFYPDAKTFAQLPSMPQQRTRHTAVVADGKIYVVGGRDGADANVNDVIVSSPEL